MFCLAFGHPLRIEVIELLQDKEQGFLNTLEVTGGLTKKGILKTRREGLYTCFSLSSEKLAQACRLMREVLIDNLKKI